MSGPQATATDGYRSVAANPYADLVGVAEVAERLGVKKTIVTNWVGRRRSNGFPTPVHRVRATPLWRWPDVETWWKAYVPQRHKTKPGRLPGGAPVIERATGCACGNPEEHGPHED